MVLRGHQCGHCGRFACAEQEKGVALGKDLGMVCDQDMNGKFSGRGGSPYLKQALALLKKKLC